MYYVCDGAVGAPTFRREKMNASRIEARQTANRLYKEAFNLKLDLTSGAVERTAKNWATVARKVSNAEHALREAGISDYAFMVRVSDMRHDALAQVETIGGRL